MRMYDVILKKKNGGSLTDDEIRTVVRGYTDGTIPDYQMAALTMAICFRGMDDRETVALTMAMAKSGDMVDLSRFGTLSVDKHSTGGVGDKTTLIVGPIVSSLGGKLAKMSGRGLGHTGGTVDKLESIPGFCTEQSPETFMRQVEQVGMAVVGQSGNLAPADKKLYALRDVTATVDSVPLIASSIMSKKLAAGAHSIVLDVKVGSGAFMKTREQAEQLARCMVDIGKACGRQVAALLTNMDNPLGQAIGNALEIQEAVEILHGHGDPQLRQVCVALAAQMLSLCLGWTAEESIRRAEGAIDSGAAFTQMKRWIAAQGGDVSCLEQPEQFPVAPYAATVVAPRSGYITHMDAQAIGMAGVALGAGRTKKSDPVDHAAGMYLAHKTGDYVRQGEPLTQLYTSREDVLPEAQAAFLAALQWGEQPPERQPMIFGVIQ